jgi:hypothetical protein
MPHSEIKYCESCQLPMNVRKFKTCAVFYCQECGAYNRTEVECEHEYELILFELDNGSEQLRNYCPKCHGRDPKILKQKEHDLTNVRRRKESKYQAFYSGLWQSESEDITAFIEELRRKQESVMFADYNRYITSEEWYKIRSMIVNRDGGLCQICGDPADHVHHLTYAHFTREFPFELVALCRDCHHREYHSPEAKKRESELQKPANVTT